MIAKSLQMWSKCATKAANENTAFIYLCLTSWFLGNLIMVLNPRGLVLECLAAFSKTYLWLRQNRSFARICWLSRPLGALHLCGQARQGEWDRGLNTWFDLRLENASSVQGHRTLHTESFVGFIHWVCSTGQVILLAVRLGCWCLFFEIVVVTC